MNLNPSGRPVLRRPVLSVALWALASLTGCQDAEQATYAIRILAPAGRNPFERAARVVLELDGGRRATREVRAGGSFELTLPGLRPTPNQTGRFTISAFADDGRLVALGRSPPIEIQPTRAVLAIFVQEPGTLANRGIEMPTSLRDLAVVSAPAVGGRATFNVPVVFGGEIVGDTATGATTRSYSNLIFIYNPVLHAFFTVQRSASARARTALLATRAGPVLALGGVEGSVAASGFPAIVEQFELVRTDPIFVEATAPERLPANDSRIARARAALAETEAVFAFGGEVAGPEGPIPIDSIVRVDARPRIGNRTNNSSGSAQLLTLRLLTPRSGATATRITTPDAPAGSSTFGGAPPGAPAVLVFGGAAPHAGGPAAERFTAAPFPAVEALSPPGGNRREHSAVSLWIPGTPPTHREPVLIAGGLNDDGQPLDSLLVYQPPTGTFVELATRLAVARWGATVFLAGHDLVVSGGIDADGRLLDQAERFDVRVTPDGEVRLTPLDVQPCIPRYNAQAAAMPDETIVILGGSRFRLDTHRHPTAETRSSPSVEIYRPRIVGP